MLLALSPLPLLASTKKLTSTISPTLNLDSVLALADRRKRKLMIVLLLLLVSLTRPAPNELSVLAFSRLGNFPGDAMWKGLWKVRFSRIFGFFGDYGVVK